MTLMASQHAVHVMVALVVFVPVLLLLRLQQTGRRRLVVDVLLASAAGAFTFQVVHSAEHLLQIWYWKDHRNSIPLLSTWAMWGRDSLAVGVTGGFRGTATEVLHLVGNAVYWSGMVAALLALRMLGATDRKWCRRTVVVQGLHLCEHIALVTTLLWTGSADGLTTLFGLIEPGTTAAFAMRVWLHGIVNLAVTLMGVEAMRELVLACRAQPRQRRFSEGVNEVSL